MQALPAGRGLDTQLPLFVGTESPRDVDVHAISRPARGFTGDFYFLHRSGDTLWLIVGDVAGKGIEAAVVMAMIQEQLDGEIETASDVSAVMMRLHLSLRSILPRNRFATVAVAQIRDDGRLVVANGGHCPLLIARPDGSVDMIGSTGPVVGLLADSRWRSIEFPFRRGDTLLAYTDGVTEARSERGEEFGLTRLRDVFTNAALLGTPPQVGSAIEEALASYAAEDDVTIIVARR